MEQFCDKFLIWILYYKNSELTHQYEFCDSNWYCFPCYEDLICSFWLWLRSDLNLVIASVVLCLTVIESQIIIYSDLRWPLKNLWYENEHGIPRSYIACCPWKYISWWWSSVNIMNIVSFTYADKQDICYSSVSSNALNVMVYELLNPMFCMSLCLQLLILHTNCALKICWGPVPNRPTY